MLNHISIGVRDIARTKRFYDAALKPLGYKALSEGETSLGYGKDNVVLWISASDKPVLADEKSGLHFCFDAPTQKSVAAFHAPAPSAAAWRQNCRHRNPSCARSLQPCLTSSWCWTPKVAISKSPQPTPSSYINLLRN